MIVALSRFTIANGMSDAVRTAFRERPHLVDVAAGFLGMEVMSPIDMPAENYVNAVMWLGAQLPTDPRFGVSIAHVMYKGIIGDGPLVLANKTELANDDDPVRVSTPVPGLYEPVMPFWVVNARTSWPLTKVPPVIDTVPEARFVPPV